MLMVGTSLSRFLLRAAFVVPAYDVFLVLTLLGKFGFNEAVLALGSTIVSLVEEPKERRFNWFVPDPLID